MRQIWTSADHCTIDRVPFRYGRHRPRGKHKTTANEVIVLKPREVFEWYVDRLRGHEVARMLELGIFEGGSAMLFADILPDAKIVAVDKRPSNPEVIPHLAALGFTERISLHYGISQDDPMTMPRIIAEEFGPSLLDLVVDDASHRYMSSRLAFEMIFPQLRPGGLYIIEDWGWAHWRDWEGPKVLKAETVALSNLVLELVMASASSPGIVARVETSQWHAVIERGPDKIGKLVLNEAIELQGRRWHRL